MNKVITILLFFLFLTSCHGPYTYVTYDRKGRGDVKLKKGLLYDNPDEENPLTNPRFRSEGKPLKKKKVRIKRAKKRYEGI